MTENDRTNSTTRHVRYIETKENQTKDDLKEMSLQKNHVSTRCTTHHRMFLLDEREFYVDERIERHRRSNTTINKSNHEEFHWVKSKLKDCRMISVLWWCNDPVHSVEMNSMGNRWRTVTKRICSTKLNPFFHRTNRVETNIDDIRYDRHEKNLSKETLMKNSTDRTIREESNSNENRLTVEIRNVCRVCVREHRKIDDKTSLHSDHRD